MKLFIIKIAFLFSISALQAMEHDPSLTAFPTKIVMHDRQEDGSLKFRSFTLIKDVERGKGIEVRIQIETLPDPQNLTNVFPEITLVCNESAEGLCFNYAFKRFLNLKTFTYVEGAQYGLIEGLINPILSKYFAQVKEPQEDDMAVYFNHGGESVHFGLWCSDGSIKSKWGQTSLYRHPPFYVRRNYGDIIRFYRLKEGVASADLKAGLMRDRGF